MRFFTFLLAALLFSSAAVAQTGQTVVLRKLLIAPTDASALAMRIDKGGDSRVVVQDVPLLAGADFLPVVLPFFGQPLSLESVNAMASAIKQYGIKNDRLINILVPDQPKEDVMLGVVRLTVIVNRYNELDFKGNRWFSSKLLRDKLGVRPGDEISIARLDEAVNWANTNPFRRVQVMLHPLDTRPGSTDLIIGVEERIPLRLLVSYDDSGNEILGKRHYTGSLQYGNFLGRDHQLSYQFSTSDHQGVFKAHSLNYQVPLPWRHRLDISANYLLVNPSFLGGVFNQTGKNIGTDVRYTYPLRSGDNPVEVFGGLSYKQNNNNLAYGGFNFGGLVDVFQVATGFSAIRRDKQGAWALGLTLNLSPGRFNSRNTNDAFEGKNRASFFNTGRVGARAQYAYGLLSMQRVQNLQRGWQFLSRGTIQLSTANLVGSEQISIGGSSTVRGFDERILTGDAGFVVSNDLQAPPVRTKLAFITKKLPPLESRFSVFYDAGHLRTTHPTASDIPQYPLASSGVGVRMNVGLNFNVSADYGWQITRLPDHYSSSRNRGHVKVVLAY